MNKIFSSTNTLKVLSFLSDRPVGQFLAVEIQKAVKISKGGVSISLRELVKAKLVNREAKGNSYLYSAAHGEPVVRQFKVLSCVALLEPLLNRLKEASARIILFGSSARGEDSPDSDIDLCIVTNSPQQIQTAIQKTKLPRPLQPIIRTPVQFIEMQKSEPVFWSEISKGIVLWETKG